MRIKEVKAGAILDSRKDKTILVSIKTSVGSFSASSPTGKSTGKFEVKPYKKSLEDDIKTIEKFSEYFSGEDFVCFDCLEKIEDIIKGHAGANTLFALESATLKAIAKEQNKQVWKTINERAKKFPRLVGNCMGGGMHTKSEGKKPDFQEFLLIPNLDSVSKSQEINRKAREEICWKLKKFDENFKEKKNDEDAWLTSLNDKSALEVLKDLINKKIMLGIDVASSSFYKRKKYHYLNPKLDRTEEEQFDYISNLVDNFDLYYIEDPFYEDDFEAFAKLTKKFPKSLIVGDDLTVTNVKRLQKAIKVKSINGIIIKPNQCGSLLNVKKVCELAKKHNIKIVFSHRSGETDETILADLAFGFGADFFKCGITGKEREAKISRLIEIEKSIK